MPSHNQSLLSTNQNQLYLYTDSFVEHCISFYVQVQIQVLSHLKLEFYPR
jgi:hypothetical protein